MTEQPQSSGERKEERHSEVLTAYKKARRGERAKRVGIVLVSLALAAILIVTCYGVFLIRHQQVTNTAVATDTHTNSVTSKRLLHIINDCINPNGDCAQANSAKTAHILNQFQALVIIGNLCAKDPHVAHNYQAFSQCVSTIAQQHGISPSK